MGRAICYVGGTRRTWADAFSGRRNDSSVAGEMLPRLCMCEFALVACFAVYCLPYPCISTSSKCGAAEGNGENFASSSRSPL